jgi:hypothetical protein
MNIATSAWLFARYRRGGGPRAPRRPTSSSARVPNGLTRDPAWIRTYFPEVALIAPNAERCFRRPRPARLAGRAGAAAALTHWGVRERARAGVAVQRQISA